MNIRRSDPQVFSFEFFPPKTPNGQNNLRTTRQQLAGLHPHFFSVTFGAGGSTQSGTLETVIETQRETGIQTAPHISCIGSTREKIRQILDSYLDAGIRRLVALRGDLPAGMTEAGEFRYANELVEFIRAETADAFHIEVAAYPEVHPEAPSAKADLENFKRKVQAGANSAITQYFYDVDAYLGFVENCQRIGVQVPIIPGIMPITNYASLANFSQRCGAKIPRPLAERLEGFGDDLAGLQAYGIDVVTELCRRLLEAGAPGLHFYALNRAEPSVTIWKNLDLPS
uniref:Methylenetetrahydrofolate reductase n=1 Tax=Candidatus Kentrum sp. FM TaxID=2126340 RepID=A0A450TR82_9GAMM|nr:MAG: methylenetetrahydrofolate reductase (NADPH) [Candidatus Kentron sp. FM]VFJ75797.1 MAG: methylenetetrahydrofolate reductase (NADPH) [Candidatus Kentron sp. FM]VFK18266.1 MAG: methylenetetrahydrofolate reductase (NADPH) [Candidatus Kentron sp. FM]